MENSKKYDAKKIDVPARCQLCHRNPAAITLTSVESFKAEGKATNVTVHEKLCVRCSKEYYPEEVVELVDRVLKEAEEIEERHAPIAFRQLPGVEA